MSKFKKSLPVVLSILIALIIILITGLSSPKKDNIEEVYNVYLDGKLVGAVKSKDSLEKYIDENSVVADLGCGSGILSIISLLLGAKSAFAVDIDANAIKTAYENAELSGVDVSKYYVTSGNVIDDKKLQDEIGYDKYDVVVANIIADVICAISPVVPAQLKKGGVFIASGIIKDRMNDVYDALDKCGLKVVNTSTKDEWVCITSIKE